LTIPDVTAYITDNEAQMPVTTQPYAWYTAATGTVADVNDQVYYWQDISGNLKDLTSAIGGGPVRVADGGDGNPTLTFDGSQGLWTTSTDFGSLAQPTVVFAVATVELPSSSARYIYDSSSSSGRNIMSARSEATWEIYGGGPAAQVGTADSGSRQVLMTYYGTLADPNLSAMYTNGNLEGAAVNVGSQSLDGLVVGARYNGANRLVGEIAELIVYNGSVPDQAEIDAITDYLALKYIGKVGIFPTGVDTRTSENPAAADPNEDTYEVQVFGNPTASVDVTATPADNQIDIGNGAGVAKVLNFASPGVQTLTIIGEDNSTSEGPRDVAISHTSSSTDATYTGLTISDQVVTVEDDEPWCGMVGTTYFDSDLNEDCHVTLEDFAILAANWLGCTHPADAGCN
jgi:hypothetical protein